MPLTPSLYHNFNTAVRARVVWFNPIDYTFQAHETDVPAASSCSGLSNPATQACNVLDNSSLSCDYSQPLGIGGPVVRPMLVVGPVVVANLYGLVYCAADRYTAPLQFTRLQPFHDQIVAVAPMAITP
ncbi:uncharacterized protein LOC132193911 [Neocloeon triangulifer]|uniref:uncharacterized protein LOC132193911 n=1 Tax=Neocloeon triangulifer TaxID=2078957 RepID=UPI00286F39CC|nr:uncharacterized protein LOC132193911 [Neocloeon triangulifer]